MTDWAIVVLLSLSPISELRGAIPYGILSGLTPWKVVLLAGISNALVFWAIVIILDLFYESRLKNMRIVQKGLERVSRMAPLIKSKGYWGLLPLVAVPLPITGVWTASLLTWVFDLTLPTTKVEGFSDYAQPIGSRWRLKGLPNPRGGLDFTPSPKLGNLISKLLKNFGRQTLSLFRFYRLSPTRTSISTIAHFEGEVKADSSPALKWGGSSGVFINRTKAFWLISGGVGIACGIVYSIVMGIIKL